MTMIMMIVNNSKGNEYGVLALNIQWSDHFIAKDSERELIRQTDTRLTASFCRQSGQASTRKVE